MTPMLSMNRPERLGGAVNGITGHHRQIEITCETMQLCYVKP
jgi:hypothetical protein